MHPELGISLTLSIVTLFLYHLPYADATILYDNIDPHIQYLGSWQMVNTSAAEGDFEGTLAFANENSLTATLEFTGTAVTVYGALEPVGIWNMQSAYYVDGLAVVGYHPNSEVTAEQHGVVFYSSGPLGDGSHTLKIVNMGQQFWFDYIAVETAPVPESASPMSESITTTTPSTSQEATRTLRQPTTGSATFTNTSSTRSPVYIPPGTLPPPASIGTANLASSQPTSTPNLTLPIPSNTPLLLSTASTPTVPTAEPTTLPSPASSASASSVLASSSQLVHGAGSGGLRQQGTSGHFPVGAIIGVAVGGTVLLLVVSAVLFVVWRRHRRMKIRSMVTPFRPAPDELLDASPSPPSSSEKFRTVDETHSGSLSSPPPGNLLVIMHGDDSGGVWADYHSSVPSASVRRISDSSHGAVIKM
ncbi:hypothetical protein BC628DRAFT_1418391 [Trametes gibbosa]|nr:hypothetical protein BC628DRAFT_1418391 [Trametes gibbosa]